MQNILAQSSMFQEEISGIGIPAQSSLLLSIAGKRKGQRAGTRSGLLLEAGRIIFESKAQLFIAENVKGLSSVNEGLDFYETFRFLTELDTGSPKYTVECQLLNTAWLLPQNRERYYFVGRIEDDDRIQMFLTQYNLEHYAGSQNIDEEEIQYIESQFLK